MKKLLLLIFDIFTLGVSLVFTLLIRYPENTRDQVSIHSGPFTFVFLIFILVFYISNLYEPRISRNSYSFFSNLTRTVIVGAGLSIAFFYLAPQIAITPKTNLFIFLAVFLVLAILNRWIFNTIFEKGRKKSVIILGTSQNALELARVLKENRHLGYEFKYIVDINPESREHGSEDFGIIEGVGNLERILKSEKIDTIVIGEDSYQYPQLVQSLYNSLGRGIVFESITHFYERLTGKVLISGIGQAWFLENINDRNKVYNGITRLMDIVLSVIGLVVSLPLYPLIILFILITSPGSIFYRQIRVGRKGREFSIIKFRTMKPNAEKETGAVWAQDKDPRITAFGKFMRATRLDEVPQFWNVLKGDLAFVGPRAERPEFHSLLSEKIPFYEARYLIRPGLTGWAQINYRYGSSVEDAAEKLKYDLYYIKHRSIFFDLGIALRTIGIVLSMAGK